MKEKQYGSHAMARLSEQEMKRISGGSLMDKVVSGLISCAISKIGDAIGYFWNMGIQEARAYKKHC